MVIYSSGGTPILDIKVDDSSYKYEEIMGDCNVYLEFALTEHIEIEPGSYIIFQGVKYVMMTRENVSVRHRRNYEYKATFSGPAARLNRYVVYNYIDGRLRFEMIGKPWDFLSLIYANLDLRERGMWSIGDYIDKDERLIAFNHTSVRDALNAIAEAFDTEWSIEASGSGYVINLRKQEFNKNNPLALGYGKNQGFKPGVGRYNFGEFGQVEKVWIDGGERNLSIGEYGWTTLHFPPSLTFSMDGDNHLRYTIDGQIYQETPFDNNTALTFVTDDWGASVKLINAADNCIEASLDLTEYYPKRIGEVTGVYYLYKGQYLTYQELIALEEVNWEEVQVDIVDSTIETDTTSGAPDSLDYSQYLFSNDQPLTVIFQDGMLAGREFNATFVKKAKTRTQINEETGEEETIILRPANRFELIRTTIDGVDMPNDVFRPNTASTNDKYIVVNCYLPKEYIRDFANFGGAEIDALREACKFIRANKDPQFTFKGTVDDLYSKRNWLNVGGKLILGGCISFQDSSIQTDAIVTRIVGLKTYINKPYAPEVTLSNETVKGGMSSMLAKLKAEDEHVIERVKEARRFSMRSFRDAKETIAMLAGSIDYFSEGVNPITVETMSLLVGYEALQFRFWTTRSCTTPVVNPVTYDPDTHKLSVDACVIQHMTHGITDVKPSASRHYYDFLRWSMASFESPALTGVDEQGGDNSSSAYYLYAKVDAANVAKADEEMSAGELAHIYGEFVLTKTKKDIKEKLTPTDTEYREIDGVNTEFSYYYLLVGILNSEYEGGRSFAPMYGFTEVLPGQITTDVIRSAAGDSYFDLVNNQFALGESLTFINNVLTLRGALVQRGDGTYTSIGRWCGQWTAGVQYSEGDEVWWQASDGTISSYRYIYPNPTTASAANSPSHSSYWQVFAQGVAGAAGDDGTPGAFKSTAFIRTNDDLGSSSYIPTGGDYTSPIPTSTHTDSSTHEVLSWSDGIPAGQAKLWASSCTFKYDGTSSGWSIPRQMTDTETFDVEFAKRQPNDATPDTPTDANRHGGSGTQVWFDPVLDSSEDFSTMYWRAERECNNGEWGPWTIIPIKGEKGDDGNGIDDIDVFYAFSTSSTTPPGTWPYDESSRPSLSGHSGEYFWTKTVIKYTDTSKADKITYTAQYIPSDGSDGNDGAVGPMLVYRGEYNKNDRGEYDTDGSGRTIQQTYYGTDLRRDVVWHDNRWWMALDVRSITPNGSGQFSAVVPGTSAGNSYWSSFEGNFSNVATGLLLADKAFLDKAIVRYLQTYDPDSSAKITAEENWMELADSDGVTRFKLTGDNVDLGTPVNTYSIPSVYKARKLTTSSGSHSISEVLASNIVVSSGDTIQIPSIGITTGLSDSGATASTSVVVTLYNGYTSIWSRTASTSNSGADTRTTSTGSGTITNATAGTYRLEIEIDVTYTTGDIPMAIYTFDAVANGSVAVSGDNAQMVQIGANGLVAHLKGGFSAVIATDPSDNNSQKIVLQGMRNGNVIGLRITAANGVEINRGDSNNWVSL